MLSFYAIGLKRIFNFAKKVFIILAVYVIIVSLFIHFIGQNKPKIAADPIKKNRQEIYKVVNDKELNKTKQGKLAIAVYKITMCGVLGEACTKNPDDGDKNFKNSLAAKLTGLFILPYANPPASGVMWAYTGLQSAGFISKTYATEGFGFAAIRPYANLWKIFRDVAYMFLVIVLVAIGFMIMFRMKMNPQTVISIENALPRIVVALILVTFSFAIAGLLIDLMYVVIVLIISLLSNGGTYYNTTQFQNEYVVADIGRLFKDVAGRYGYDPTGIAPIIADSIIGIIPPSIAVILRVMIGIIAVFAVNGLLDNILLRRVGEAFGIGSVAGSDLKPLLRLFSIPVSFATIFIVFFIGMLVIFPLLMWLFIIFTILFLAIRIFILLFTSYIKLILTIIISPFLLMFEAVPGKSPFTSWFKNIVGYLLGFPITIAVCLIGYIIINSSLPSTYNPMYLPYLYGIHSNSFKILIGMGLIFLIPDWVKLAKEALGIKEMPIPFGIGTFFGGAGAIGGGTLGILGQFSTFSLGMRAIGRGGGFLGLGKETPTKPPTLREAEDSTRSATETPKVNPTEEPSSVTGNK